MGGGLSYQAKPFRVLVLGDNEVITGRTVSHAALSQRILNNYRFAGGGGGYLNISQTTAIPQSIPPNNNNFSKSSVRKSKTHDTKIVEFRLNSLQFLFHGIFSAIFTITDLNY